MARTWKCKDCPATGTQERGYLRVRCDDCKRVAKRKRFRAHYAKNKAGVLANQKKRRRENADVIAEQVRERRRQKSPHGFIYLLEAVGSDTFKIGFSSTETGIEKRITGCQTGNAYPIRLRGVIEGTMMDEADLHRILADCRMAGEWFSLSSELKRISRKHFGYQIRRKTSVAA